MPATQLWKSLVTLPMRDLVVVGAGGFGRETLDVIEAINRAAPDPKWRVIGIVDDELSGLSAERLRARGYSHLGSISEVLALPKTTDYVVGIGNPQVREQISLKFDYAGWNPVSLIHPASVIGSLSHIAAGSVICSGVQISTNTLLGRHVHLNPGVIVGHDSRLDDYVSVNPGAVISGEVEIGLGSLIGAGAVVLQGLSIAENCIVGAAACVTRPVDAGLTVTGIPARSTAARHS